MRAGRPAIVLLGCLIAGRLSSGQALEPPASFLVAVTHGETLLPLARYESGRWVNTWPAPDHETPVPPPVPALADVPTAWLGRPVPRDWTVWFPGGATRRVQVAGLEHHTDVCVVSPHLTLRERLDVPSSEADSWGSGLATTDGAAVVPVRAVQIPWKSSAEAAALLLRIQPAVEKLFTEHEGAVLAGGSGYDLRQAGLTAPALASIRPKIDWLYATAAGPSVLYFEASKRAPQATAQRLTVRGWLRLDRGKVTPLGIEAYAESDDEVGPNGESLGFEEDQGPLGVIRAGGRSVWIMEIIFGETVSYVFYDVGTRAAHKLLDIDAGGC